MLADIAPRVERDAPHLRHLYATFASEAMFGREWIAPHLEGLAPGGRILEVGAGLMLLSCQLAREGYDVTALEPVGTGFSDFHVLQEIVRGYAQDQGISFRILPVPVEQLQDIGRYGFAFSMNVMEHVSSVATALHNVVRSLEPGASYAFVCPNYRFPYEPHFGIPVVGSKRLTGWLFARAIRNSKRVQDPAGAWASLNWISVKMIDRACAALGNVEWRYDRESLPRALERVTRDAEFAGRRAGWMRAISRALVQTGAHRLAGAVPAWLQPMIDCTVVRKPTGIFRNLT